jgi:MYXO-CTERM domain-containing protein
VLIGLGLGLGLGSEARAFVGGAPGNSGASSKTCNDCHSGGVKPTVTITGADALAPGETQTYVIVVSSASPMFDRFAGVDVAASGGTLAAHPSQNADVVQMGEVVTSKLAGPFATLQFQFDLTAPAQTGPLTLFGDGLSCDGNGGPDGDSASTATKTVMVQEAADMAGQLPDLAGADLAVVDAVSGATSTADMAAAKTAKDEPRWGCDCSLGARGRDGPLLAAAAALLALALLGRRRRR